MKQQIHADLEKENLPQLRGTPLTGCTGMIRRDGWCYQDINAHAWKLPHWKCDKCGAMWWSYFDTDSGDKGHDTEAEDEIDWEDCE